MRIILGCDPLLMPLTGIGHYTRQIGCGLANNEEVEILKLFAHGSFFSAELLKAADDNETNGHKEVKLGWLAKLRMTLAASKTVVKLYQLVTPHIMGFALRNHSEYIFHSPNFSLPPFGGKKIVTIHDLSTIRFAHCHPPARVQFVNQAIRDSVNEADHIITDSQLVKDEIIEYFSVVESKVTVIPLGADASFHPRTAKHCHQVLSVNQLEYNRYFLFVSTLEPRKNIENLLTAYQYYRHHTPNGLPLVLVGGKGWNSDAIHLKVQSLIAKGWVKYLGYVPQYQVPVLYSGARALLFPSTYEGFGLPVLEAMQSGTAVLTSKNSAMAEITLDSAILVAPEDVSQMATFIEALAQDDQLLETLVSKGLERATHFSWQKSVSDTLSVYQRISSAAVSKY
jgi:glycosyltransferase involved in cell wall biosynthesis